MNSDPKNCICNKPRYCQCGLLNRGDIKIIADKLGLRYQLITDPRHQLNACDTRNLDPDIVYVFNPGCPLVSRSPKVKHPIDAVMCYQGGLRDICWGTSCNKLRDTKAAIRKVLEGSSTECVICFEAVSGYKRMNCSGCGSILCIFCQTRLCLNAEGVELIKRGKTELPFSCVQCRRRCCFDTTHCVRAMDRFKDFDENQQAALNLLRATDPSFEARCESFANCIREQKAILAKTFSKGKLVKVYGLKNKNFKKWNGKKAIIVGKRVIKNGTIRWPIQLKGERKSKEHVLIKQCNLRKLF